MSSRAISATLAAIAASLIGAPAAAAERFVVTSFDGTPIVTNFFAAEGLEAGQRAPTIMIGPGFSFAGASDPDAAPIAPFREAGYNVVTWDPRGFGGSGGEAQIDSEDFEGRDVQAIIDVIAGRAEVELEDPGDPVLGMSGGSYGGAIQFVTAAIDRRVDAIAPEIAWHSLITALFRDGDLKGGWGLALCGVGLGNGTAAGLVGPGGFQAGSVAPQVQRTCTEGTATGAVRNEDREWFRQRDMDGLLQRITAPTLIVQGTVDTLFTPQEAIENFTVLDHETDVPLRMMWFCGGHGGCLTGAGEPGHKDKRVLAWMDRWLKGDQAADVGPRFEWLADDAVWRSADHFPLVRTGALRGEGQGLLPLSPAAVSGSLVLATPLQAGALEIPIEPAAEEADLLGAPELRITYTGTAAQGKEHVYAQIVDEQRNVVVGNQVTPIPVTLDGKRHTADISLEPIAARARPGDRYRLQLIPASNVYYPLGATGLLTVESARIELPVVDPSIRPEPRLRLTRRCTRGGRLRMSLAGADVERVRDVSFKFGRRLAARDTRVGFSRLAPRRMLARTRARRLRAVAYLEGRPAADRVVLSRSLLRCGR